MYNWRITEEYSFKIYLQRELDAQNLMIRNQVTLLIKTAKKNNIQIPKHDMKAYKMDIFIFGCSTLVIIL